MGKILLTGANGFIGSHITEYFVKNNENIVCLVRKSSDLKYISNLDVDIIYADIRNTKDLNKVFKDIDFVIHVSGKVSDWGKYEDFYTTNVLGSLNILNMAFKNGIKNFIFTSTNSVYGEENCYKTKDENSPYNSHYNYFMDKLLPSGLNFYRDTKRIAKEEISKFAKEKKINITFIEPVWVYGEREFSSGFYEYVKTTSSKMPFLMGSKKNNYHIIYIKDLVRAYYLAYKKSLKGVNSFIIGNSKSENMNETYKIFCNEANFKKPKNLPKFIIYPIGLLLESLYTIINSKKPPLLTRGRINMFYDNIEYSTKKAKEVLGFENKFTKEEGIKRTIKWYKENGYLG
jgi:nucleoside-diphosphate-sugar epimerase